VSISENDHLNGVGAKLYSFRRRISVWTMRCIFGLRPSVHILDMLQWDLIIAKNEYSGSLANLGHSMNIHAAILD
jgi:hypothetical protein